MPRKHLPRIAEVAPGKRPPFTLRIQWDNGDRNLVDVSGLIETFRMIKDAELERFRTWVTDWEFAEYSPRL